MARRWGPTEAHRFPTVFPPLREASLGGSIPQRRTTATPLEILSHRVVWSLLLMIAVVLVLRNPHAVPRAVSSRRQLGIYLVTTGLITTNWLIFIWAVKKGEFEDVEKPKHRMLDDD